MKYELKKPDPKEARTYFESKLAFTVGPYDVKFFRDHGQRFTVIDVREEADFREGHIPGAINLPWDRWESLEGLDHDQVNVVYCYTAVCHLAARAAAFFAEHGFSVVEMEGGIEAWNDYGYETETTEQRSKHAA